MGNRKIEYRTEKDRHGEMPVPAGVYWGISTARAMEFARSESMHPRFLRSLVMVKKAAAEANIQLGRVEPRIARAVSLSAEEILSGQWQDQFPVSILQAGSQAAVCANIDEVLANRAGEVLGGQLGKYDIVHPIEHVSAGQTPYDIFPVALRLSLLDQKSELEACLLDLERLLRRKALELDKVIKPGRVHLQDSVPISLGQVFNSWGSSVGRSCKRLFDLTTSLSETSPGSGETGTGFGTVREFPALVVEKLIEISGTKLRLSDDPIRLNQSMSDYVALSSVLREIAIELMKISADLRLMSSGPAAGIAELKLPVVHMERTPFPNFDRAVPIVPEFTSMLCMQVLGNDVAVSAAARDGQLECNAMLPLIAHNLLGSLDALIDGINLLTRRCISGVTADASHCTQNVAATGVDALLLATAFGAEAARILTAEASERSVSIREIVLERQLMTVEQFERAMNVKTLLSSSPASGPREFRRT